MRVGVAYADGAQQVWLRVEVPDEATVRDAIERSGLLQLYPRIDLESQRVGVFGKLAKLDAPLNPGDRVEIYRSIVCDPAEVPRRRGMSDDDDD